MPSQGPRHIKTTVGENIRVARQAAGLSQAALGRALPQPTDGPSVSRWERGTVMPGMDNLVALATVLGTDVGWLVTDHREGRKAA